MLETYKKQKYCSVKSIEVSRELTQIFSRRRTIRHFSPEIPPLEVVMNAVDVARLAPSGANRQPWNFTVVNCQETKSGIRELAEKEERDFYINRPNEQWINDLKHLHTDEDKTFLEHVPYLIVIFHSHFDIVDGVKETNYYAKESAGIATGFLISALHMSGLSTLTYTPKRMNFLTEFLGRPTHERPFMILATGLPAEGCEVPVISKKSLEDVCSIYS